jgi:pimeloyl-ACP methyl ester carboxylesterase
MTLDAGFLDRYQAVMAKWPVPYESLDLPGRFGTTHVNVCGPADGSPVVLMHGGRATSAGWFNTVGAFAGRHRVYAIDTIGDSGRSVADGERIRDRDGIVSWLDETLSLLGVTAAAFVGHSVGAWNSMSYALAHPDRVSRLVLLDPTSCVVGNRPTFMLRAIPLMLRPGPERYRSFIRWETRGASLDPAWLDLWAGRFGGPTGGAWPKRPPAAELARLTMPVLVVVAGRSRQNDARRLATLTPKIIPGVRMATLANASHFTIPQQDFEDLNPVLAEYLG